MRFCKFILILLLVVSPVFAEQTTGGVNWLDPLNYQKPQFYPITVPDEASCPNKYYIDQQNGSGTTCTETSPGNWSGLSGKPGTAGGPAYIYLKGNARLNLTGTLYGSSGNEIVIKPWPGSSTPVVMTRRNSTSTNDANIISSQNVHHVIMDGGPDMLFRFIGAGSTQNAYTFIINSDYVKVTRCRIDGNGIQAPTVGIATGSGQNTSYTYLINCEVYEGAYYGMYTGGGTGCNANDTWHDHTYILNNIFRNLGQTGIQVEPRNSASYVYIDRNAFHHTGENNTRPAIDPVVGACGGSFNNVYIRNNLIFNVGGGGISLSASDSSTYVYNNTIYDFAHTTPITLNSHGITSTYDGNNAIVMNNIILKANNGANYINRSSGWTKSHNLYPGGPISGSPSSEFLSTDNNNPDLLKLKENANAVDAGIDLSGSFTGSYFGTTRPQGNGYDIGCNEFGSIDTTPPAKPTGLYIIE